MLEVVEYINVDLVKRPVEFNEFPEVILEIVLLGELEDRLAHFLAEPDHGLADQLRGPMTRADHPRSDGSGQERSGHLVGVEGDVVMLL